MLDDDGSPPIASRAQARVDAAIAFAKASPAPTADDAARCTSSPDYDEENEIDDQY